MWFSGKDDATSTQTPRTLIAIVDDEQDVCETIRINLEKAGYEVAGFGDTR